MGCDNSGCPDCALEDFLHDVSTEPKRAQQLQKYRSDLKEAATNKGQPLPSTVPKDTKVQRFIDFAEFENAKSYSDSDSDSDDEVELPLDYLPPAYPPSVAPVDQLTRLMISDLKLETNHRGHYVLLKTITPMHFKTRIMVIVEDEKGNTLTLQLHNQGSYLQREKAGKGTVFLVKEPYVTKVADETYGIRVDHLSDVKLVPKFDTSTPNFMFRGMQGVEGDDVVPANATASAWRKKGNDFFEKEKYGLAIECYTKVLETAPPVLARAIRLNRALAYIKTIQYDAALLDTEEVLLVNKHSEKGLFRKGQALQFLQRIPESCETYRKLRAEHPHNKLAKSYAMIAERQLLHEQNGQYDFLSMMRMAREKCPHLECGSYIGSVAVRPTQNHGRGLFTTKAVKAGDLLLCEKAFAYAAADYDSDNVRYLFNADTGKVTKGTQVDLVEMVIQSLHKNPSLLPLILDLYHGDYESVMVREVDGAPIIDSFLVDRIVELNCFGCSIFTPDTYRNVVLKQTKGLLRNLATGLWCMASYINHSCFRNATHTFFGDMIVVRASQDLPADTEIKVWYKSGKMWPGLASQAPIELKHWNFTCDCIMCHSRKACGKRKFSTRRRIFLEDFNSLANEPTPHSKEDAATMERALLRLGSTYPKPCSEVPRIEPWAAYAYMARSTLMNGFGIGRLATEDIERAINFGMKALESLGFIIEGGKFPRKPGKPLTIQKWGLVREDMLSLWVFLCAAYSKVAPDVVDQALACAKLTYKICLGEDETFDKAWHEPLTDLRTKMMVKMW